MHSMIGISRGRCRLCVEGGEVSRLPFNTTSGQYNTDLSAVDMMFASSLFVTLLLVASSTAVNKLSCYVCNSEQNPSCGDPIKTGDGGLKTQVCNSDFTDAALNAFNVVSKGVSNILGIDKPPTANFACFKASYTVKSGDMEKKVVQRGCTLEQPKICDAFKEKQKDQPDLFCEECSTDECNGSSAIHAAAFVLVPAVALLLATR